MSTTSTQKPQHQDAELHIMFKNHTEIQRHTEMDGGESGRKLVSVDQQRTTSKITFHAK